MQLWKHPLKSRSVWQKPRLNHVKPSPNFKWAKQFTSRQKMLKPKPYQKTNCLCNWTLILVILLSKPSYLTNMRIKSAQLNCQHHQRPQKTKVKRCFHPQAGNPRSPQKDTKLFNKTTKRLKLKQRLRLEKHCKTFREARYLWLQKCKPSHWHPHESLFLARL